MPSATAVNKRVVARLFAALNRRAFDQLNLYIAADVVDHNKIIFGEPDRPGAAFDGFRAQFEAFSDGGMFIQELIAEDDRVVARLRVTGVHTGTHPRMPVPTGRRADIEQIWIFTIVEDKITEIRGVSDRLGLFAQLGWDWPSAEPAARTSAGVSSGRTSLSPHAPPR